MAFSNGISHQTRISPVQTTDFGKFEDSGTLEKWQPSSATDLTPLHEAADHLRSSNIPVGFPTETVYGLGADATRSEAVRGIYKAKGRPSDNPLIVHVCDLTMLRSLLAPSDHKNRHTMSADPIPAIYKPLIERFWPGPLTILLPNPQPSKLAPEVTAGLLSFGARMPNSPLALSLIHLAGVPLAAPSANASTKPSPTTAEHVRHDLDGRIEIILDGGPCQVGVESTVVDGLCDPPVVLRPGGVSIDSIRACGGWENVTKGYKDQSEVGASAPRAPGMKYKHYSPKASVLLYEAPPTRNCTIKQYMSSAIPAQAWKAALARDVNFPAKIGIVSTRYWTMYGGLGSSTSGGDGSDEFALLNEKILSTKPATLHRHTAHTNGVHSSPTSGSFNMRSCELWQYPSDMPKFNGRVSHSSGTISHTTSNTYQNGNTANRTSRQATSPPTHIANVTEISLGAETRDIAHGLFSALRELDQQGVDVMFVEGIEDDGDIAAAVMNRLRKAASEILRS